MINQLASVIMYSTDLEQAKTWYIEKLNFEVNYYVPNAFLSLFHQKMGRLDFHYSESKDYIGKGPIPNYYVDDIEKVKHQLEEKSIKVHTIQQEGESPKHTWFWDFEGNIIGLEQH